MTHINSYWEASCQSLREDIPWMASSRTYFYHDGLNHILLGIWGTSHMNVSLITDSVILDPTQTQPRCQTLHSLIPISGATKKTSVCKTTADPQAPLLGHWQSIFTTVLTVWVKSLPMHAEKCIATWVERLAKFLLNSTVCLVLYMSKFHMKQVLAMYILKHTVNSVKWGLQDCYVKYFEPQGQFCDTTMSFSCLINVFYVS